MGSNPTPTTILLAHDYKMIIPEVRKHIAPDGKVWLGIITLVTDVILAHNPIYNPDISPIDGRTSYTVWQAINPQGEIVSWGYVRRLRYGYDSARKAIKRRWPKCDFTSKEVALKQAESIR